jgi:hypothetical protein
VKLCAKTIKWIADDFAVRGQQARTMSRSGSAPPETRLAWLMRAERYETESERLRALAGRVGKTKRRKVRR